MPLRIRGFPMSGNQEGLDEINHRSVKHFRNSEVKEPQNQDKTITLHLTECARQRPREEAVENGCAIQRHNRYEIENGQHEIDDNSVVGKCDQRRKNRISISSNSINELRQQTRRIPG